MKRNFAYLISLALLVIGTGCTSLVPKNVEFFQKKVQPVPVATSSDREIQRQAAALAAKRAQDTLDAALLERVTNSVIEPAKDTVILTESVTESLGPPLHPQMGDASVVAARLDAAVAGLNKKLEAYRAEVQSLQGKKIEDTGLVKVSYFTYLLCWGAGALVVLLLGSVAWGALKIYGIANPVVGLGTNAVSLGAATVSKALSQVIAGGEEFKTAVEAKFGTGSEVAKQVLDLFTVAHQKNQDSDVQVAVKTLTA
jgi:hypothetical protein